VTIDLDRFIRLRGTVRSAATSLRQGPEAAAGLAMADTYASIAQ